MDETVIAGTAADDFAEVIEQHGKDSRFWSFVASFAATVGFDMQSGDTAKTARVVTECARQYAYLAKEHPEHFRTMYTEPAAVVRVWDKVAAVALVAGVPERHFAGTGFLKIAFEKARDEQTARKAAEQRQAEQIARFQAAAAELQKNPPVIEMPVDGFAIPPGPLTTEEIERLAQEFYVQSKGKLIKVRDHVPLDGDNFGYRRTSAVFRNYDIAIVDEKGEEHVGLTIPGGKVAESTWPVVMLTGSNRGRKASIAAPDFHADGTVTENDIVLVTLPGFILRERMGDSELVELVRLDMVDYSERPIDVTAATVYLAGTDDQDNVFFDPPLPGVVDPFDPPFRNFSSMYRIDDWSQREGISVIDVYLDFESTDERADAFRSMWTHGVSYTSHGIMEVGETPLLPFVPDFVGRRGARHQGAELQPAPTC